MRVHPVFCFLLFFTTNYCQNVTYFITPTQQLACSTYCSGSIDQPFDSITQALIAANNSLNANVTFLLMVNSSTTSHFLMLSEVELSTGGPNPPTYYNYSSPQYFAFTNLTIMPVLCSQYSYPTECISDNSTITIYIKTSYINIKISNTLTLTNIILDGSEDLYLWNSQVSSSFQTALSTRARFCSLLNANYTSKSDSNLFCLQSSYNHNIPPFLVPSIFVLEYLGTITPSAFLLNFTLQNLYSYDIRAFLALDPSNSNLTISQSLFQNNYYIQGIIAITSFSPLDLLNNPPTTFPCFNCTVKIKIANSSFLDFNSFNVTRTLGSSNSEASEGYVIYSQLPALNGSIAVSITNVTIDNAISATNKTCMNATSYEATSIGFWSGLDDQDADDFKSDFNAIFSNLELSYGVSAIFFNFFSGSFHIYNNTFSNIQGHRGSAFSIISLGSSSAGSQNDKFNITNNIFSSNFAFHMAASFLISSIIPDYYSSIFYGQFIISNNTFVKNWGCPLAYGNAMIMLTLSVQFFTAETGTLPTTQSEFLYQVTNVTYLQTQPQVTINSNIFDSNLVSICNGIALHGLLSTVIKSNQFINNGVMADMYGINLLMNNTNFNPQTVNSLAPTLHPYLASSAVSVSRLVYVNISNNLFNNNWAIISGDTFLGTQITMKHIFMFSNYTMILSNNFTNNLGIPPNIQPFITNNNLLLHPLNPPLITFSYYPLQQNFSYPLVSSVNLQQNSSIIIDNCLFVNNSFEFNLTLEDFQADFLANFYITESQNPQALIGLIRPVSNVEFVSISITSEVLIQRYLYMAETTFTNNSIAGQGCFIATTELTATAFNNIQFENNYLAPSEMILQQSGMNDSVLMIGPSLYFMDSSTQGYICGNFDTFQTPYFSVMLNASNLIFQNNTGMIINLWNGQNITLGMTNATFINNTVVDGAILFASQNNTVVVNSSLFTNNDALYGMIMVKGNLCNYYGLSNNYTNNFGGVAATLFLHTLLSATENNSYFTLNTINTPPFYVYGDGVTPYGAPLYIINCGSVNFSNSIFYNNNDYSGNLAVISSNFYTSNCSIYGNRGFGCTGYAFFESANVISINDNYTNFDFTDTTVELVLVDSMSASLFQLFFTNITIINSTFTNINYEDGTVFYGIYAGFTLQNVLVQNCTSTNDSLLLMYFELSSIFITDTNFTLNSQLLQDSYSGLTSFNNCIFSNNTGGTRYKIVLQFDLSLFQMDSCTFIDDAVSFESGSFIDTLQSTNIITNSNFSNWNMSTEMLNFKYGTFNVTNCEFTKILVANDAIYSTNVDAGVLSNSYFDWSNYTSNDLTLSATSTGSLVVSNNIFNINTWNSGFAIEGGYNLTFINNTISNLVWGPVNFSVFFSVSEVQYVYFSNNLFNSTTGGGQFTCNSNGTIEWFNNTFLNNTSLAGGVSQMLMSENCQVNISNNQFIQNGATNGDGGALVFTCDSCTSDIQYQVSISSTTFQNNQATHAGGGIYWTFLAPFINYDVVFENNSATYGNDVASTPVELVLYNSSYVEQTIPFTLQGYFNFTQNPSNFTQIQTSSDFTINDVQTGLEIPDKIEFALIDIYGQIVKTDNSSKLEILQPPGNSNFTSDHVLFTAINGTYSLGDVTFSYAPNSIINITLLASTITPLPSNLVPTYYPTYLYKNNWTVTLEFINCTLGEILNADGQCELCKSGTYNFDLSPNSQQPCLSCDGHSMLCLGGDQVGPQPGHWRMNREADLILECPYSQACLGVKESNFSYTTQCATGYQGNLCYSCASGMGRFGNEIQCTDCKGQPYFYLKLIGSFLFQVILLVFTIRSTIYSNEALCKSIIKPSESVKLELDRDTLSSALLKIFVNYAQVVSIAGSITIRWPNSLGTLLQLNRYLSVPAGDSMSIDCMVQSSPSLYTNEFFIQSIVVFTVPMVIMFIIFVIYRLKSFCSSEPVASWEGNRDIVITIFVIMTSYLQPTIINRALIFFQCVNLYRNDDPIYFLNAHYDYQCFTEIHMKWSFALAIPALGLWVIALPASLLHILRKNRANLMTPPLIKKYSFLYQCYRPQRAYWDMVLMSKKFLLVFFSVFSSLITEGFQTITCFMVVAFYLYAQTKNQPFGTDTTNELEKISLLSSGALLFLGIYFEAIPSSSTVDWVMIIFGFGANAYFMVRWSIEIYRVYKEKLIEIYWEMVRITTKRKQSTRKLTEIRLMSGTESGLIAYSNTQKESGRELETDSNSNLSPARVPAETETISENSPIQSPQKRKNLNKSKISDPLNMSLRIPKNKNATDIKKETRVAKTQTNILDQQSKILHTKNAWKILDDVIENYEEKSVRRMEAFFSKNEDNKIKLDSGSDTAKPEKDVKNDDIYDKINAFDFGDDDYELRIGHGRLGDGHYDISIEHGGLGDGQDSSDNVQDSSDNAQDSPDNARGGPEDHLDGGLDKDHGRSGVKSRIDLDVDYGLTFTYTNVEEEEEKS